MGQKKVEGRPSKESGDRYSQMKQGDKIIFTNADNNEQLPVVITFVHHYKDVQTMLENEGVENVLSSGKTIEQGVESYNKIGDYKERIKKFGIYAIGVKVI